MSSGGGPLLLLPRSLLPFWEGCAPPANGRVVKAKFRWSDPNDAATDYDRACDVTESIGLITVGAGRGLLLGEEPAMTTWWPEKTGGILVRWHAAQSEASILRALGKVPAGLFAAPRFEFEVPPGDLVLFDSAYPGNDTASCESMEVPLAAGRYGVASAFFAPDDQISVTLHRLTLG